MTAPEQRDLPFDEYGPLPDPFSDDPPTDLERSLLDGLNLDPENSEVLRVLRIGHDAGRISRLPQRPARTDPGSNPVEELRRRLQWASGILVPTGVDTQGLYEVLDQLDDELSVEHGSSTHPAVQAVARELVGEGTTHTERCIKPEGIAQRQVTVYRTPWQVVDTEGGA